MCGRYSNHVEEMSNWADLLGDWPGDAVISDNIAPTQSIPVVIKEQSHRRCQKMRWGLVPAWSDTEKPGYSTFNARVETVSHKPAFRHAFAKSQSCLIPAKNYYEWQGEKGHKTKYSIQSSDHSPLLMAGLWEYWQQGDRQLYSCTILTRPATPALADLHPRMPLILDSSSAEIWLNSVNKALLEVVCHIDIAGLNYVRVS